ncbi:MAG: HD-GYP domain-containing protein, partial [Clostridiaceae bacterium]|nr:HD-GYP domain-containing protein [Clostridiaceae bacterium]
MLKLNTSALLPEMTLAKGIYDHEGKLLIESGMKLKKSYIDKFKKYNIDHVYIQWEKDYHEEIINVIAEETKLEVLNLAKNTINNLDTTINIDISKMKSIINKLIEDFMKDKGILLNLTDIRRIDEYTLGHSVNVCLLSLVVGIACNLNKEDLQTLGIGALLHDIGKIHIDNNILNKPSNLTDGEYEKIKSHSLLGYEIAKNIEGLKEDSRRIIRDHHEKYDGTGYPNGIKGIHIPIFSRIVAICDVYDALTAHRVYRQGMPPHKAIEYLISMGNHQFDYQLVKIFL